MTMLDHAHNLYNLLFFFHGEIKDNLYQYEKYRLLL